tara:strand:+ start:167 stop:286 length:120 start_codon:yes stop_codon:yes gene_type:complete
MREKIIPALKVNHSVEGDANTSFKTIPLSKHERIWKLGW